MLLWPAAIATRQSSRVINRKVWRSDLISGMHGRHKTGGTRKGVQNYKVRAKMVAVCMVRVRNMSVEETASILVCCPTWVRDRLCRCDEGILKVSGSSQMRPTQKNPEQRHGQHGYKRDRLSQHYPHNCVIYVIPQNHPACCLACYPSRCGMQSERRETVFQARRNLKMPC